MFKFFRNASSERAQSSPFALNRRANQIAQSQPELAAQLRMLAAYGEDIRVQQTRASDAKAAPASAAGFQPHLEVRTPRIFA